MMMQINGAVLNTMLTRFYLTTITFGLSVKTTDIVDERSRKSCHAAKGLVPDLDVTVDQPFPDLR